MGTFSLVLPLVETVTAVDDLASLPVSVPMNSGSKMKLVMAII